MRPQSIKMFDYLFLGSLVLGALNFFLTFDDTMAQLQADPAVASAGLGSGFAVTVFAIGMAVSLLLWFLVSRVRSKIAMWILIALTVIGLIMLPGSLATLPTLSVVTSLVITAMQLAALYYLFRPDAKAYLDKKGPVDPTTFD
ncbi:hypothetical protein ACXYN8_13205 [Altererythrobacter sp. CAU 1778]